MTGSGTLLDPYIIYDVFDLQAIEATSLTAYYELANDIDASATIGWDGGLGFQPVGLGSGFKGHFDGKGHTIDGLHINRPAHPDIGLFGWIGRNAAGPGLPVVTIQNVNLTNASIVGSWGVGILVGLSFSANLAGDISEVINCHTAGTVTAESLVGGLVGLTIAHCSITDCSSSATVVATNPLLGGSQAGGLIGMYLADPAYFILRCHATGSVTSASAPEVGGFVGYYDGAIIDQCYATGPVITTQRNGDSFAGGFVGNGINGTIRDCYARGSVTASGKYVGGFAGQLDTGINCYSTGAIIVPIYNPHDGSFLVEVGGFQGSIAGPPNVNCFWDIQTSGQATSIGGATGITMTVQTLAATGIGAGQATLNANLISLMKVQSTFTGWDFATPIWYIDPSSNDGYPALGVGIPNIGVAICEGRFQYGLTMALGSFTAWQAGLQTGDAFSQLLLGLGGGTHFFRAEGRSIFSPTNTIFATNSGYLEEWGGIYAAVQSGPGSASGNNNIIEAGQDEAGGNYDIGRGALVFPIPAGCIVNSATLRLKAQGDFLDNAFDLVLVSGIDLADIFVDADYGDLLGAAIFGSVPLPAGNIGTGWYDIILNALALAAINAAAGGNVRFGVRSSRDIAAIEPPVATSEWANFDGTPGSKPELLLPFGWPIMTGAILSFTSLALPTVTTDPVTVLGRYQATLNGTLENDGGEACGCGFGWGSNPSYGTTTPTQSKTTGQAFSQVITGLVPNTLYYFRAIATNSRGVSFGAGSIFVTSLLIMSPSTGMALDAGLLLLLLSEDNS